MTSNENVKTFFSKLKNNIETKSFNYYIKQIVNTIARDECKKNNMEFKNLNMCVITTYEYYKNIFKNKKFKINEQNYDVSPKNCGGFCDSYNNNIVIFSYGKLLKRFVKIIMATFHELQHFLDDSTFNIDDINTLDMWRLAFYMDMECSIYDGNFYKSNHDQNLFEIRANLEGVKKTKEFIKNNNIKGINYEKDMEYLDMLIDIYTYDMNTYNFYETFDRYIKVYRKNKDEMELKHFFSTFINNHGLFKDIYNLTSNIYVDKNDKRIYDCVSMIFGSDTFINEVISKENLKGDLTISQKKLYDLSNYAFKIRESCLNYIIDYNRYFFSENKQFKYLDNEMCFERYIEGRLKQFKEKYPNIEIVDPYESKFRK